MQADSVTNMEAAIDHATRTTDPIHHNEVSNEYDSADMKIQKLSMQQGSALETFGAVSFDNNNNNRLYSPI